LAQSTHLARHLAVSGSAWSSPSTSTRPAPWRLAKRDGATSKELGAVLAVLGGGRLSAMRRPHLSPGDQGLDRVDHNRLRSSRIRADRARERSLGNDRSQ